MGKENLNLRKILVTVLFTTIMLIQGNVTNAQFNPVNYLNSKFGQTDANGNQSNWIRSIGIGNFTNNGDMTHAFLHVNSNYLLLPQNGSIANLGEVFRTDCPANQSTYWRMWRGFKSVGDIFSQYSLNDIENDNFSMQATVRDITFHTQPFDVNIIGEERMRIVGKEHSFEGIDILPGNVGIGTKHPASMLHIGDFTASVAGWREWMDIGTFYSSILGLDNMYVGLQYNDVFDKNDAIINWGNNPTTQPTSYDHLRFVFTANAFVGLPASGEDGLEIARMVSDGTHGFMGIGDFFTENDEPTETLDVKGNARIRQVPQGDFDRALVIDDDGVLYWRNFEVGGPGTSLGNECDGPITNPLNVNWEIPLDEYNFVFTGQFQDKTRVGIGIDGCNPEAKLDVLINTGEFGSTAIQGVVEDGDFYQVGIKGISTASEPSAIGIGVHGMAKYSQINTGVVGIANHAEPFNIESTFNFGGRFIADYGRTNVAGFFHAPSLDQSSENNYGVYAVCPPHPDASGLEHNWAGYFVGNVHVDGKITYTVSCTPGSDQQFKQDIVDYNGALEKIRDLRPVNFYFDTVNYDLNFPTDMQYGLIAQEVETVLPELVSNEIIPEKFDTAGNIISESIPYKSLDYLQLTPILVQSVKEIDNNLTEIVKIP
ncbi:MAG TPA: tail fiber domain-containing protein, partial [Chitinophagaceae bacterium]|nr:tail fiber domain-containing protein [Chitinophagaceae bacterium]